MAKGGQSDFRLLESDIQKFIKCFVKHGNATRAAREAGLGEATGPRLLKLAQVREAVTKAKDKVMEEIGYDLKQAMREAEDGIQFAIRTDNANAYAKFVEIRSKLNGLLVDKLDVRSLTAFSINIVGIGGNSRPLIPAAAPEAKQISAAVTDTIMASRGFQQEESEEDSLGDPFAKEDSDPFADKDSASGETEEEDPFS